MSLTLDQGDARNIWFEIPSEHIALPLTLGDGAQPRLLGGYNGYTVQTRSRRRAIAYWSGPPPWTQEVPVLLDAWVERDNVITKLGMTRAQFVAAQWLAIQTAYTPSTVTDAPPLCRLSGAALKREGANWALIDVTENGAPHREHPSGRLLRWEGTLTFMQLESRDVMNITQHPRSKRFRIVTLRQAHVSTVEQLAAKYLHNSKRWRDITFADGTKIKDPDAVKPTVPLRVPYE